MVSERPSAEVVELKCRSASGRELRNRSEHPWHPGGPSISHKCCRRIKFVVPAQLGGRAVDSRTDLPREEGSGARTLRAIYRVGGLSGRGRGAGTRRSAEARSSAMAVAPLLAPH